MANGVVIEAAARLLHPLVEVHVARAVRVQLAGELRQRGAPPPRHHRRADRRPVQLGGVVQRRLLADHDLAGDEALVAGDVLQVLQQVGLARAEVAGSATTSRQSAQNKRGKSLPVSINVFLF